MKALITGRAGSGKTTVAHELRRRGYNAFDTNDIEGLSSWIDLETGVHTILANNTYVDRTKYGWRWDTNVLKQLLATDSDLFVCGGADNDFDFDGWFDKHFVLSIEPSLQILRLKDRANNDYGKDPRMFDVITAQQAAHVATGHKHSAIILDASKPITAVVDIILETLL